MLELTAESTDATKTLVHNEMETSGKACNSVQTQAQSAVISLHGCAMGKQVVGLKEILIEKPEFSANIPQLGWLCFYRCQLLYAFPLLVEGGQLFPIHRASYTFFFREKLSI